MIVGAGLVGALVASRLKFFPLSAWLIGGGVLLAVAVESFSLDTGIRASNFKHLVFYVLLPVLVFEASYAIPKKDLRQLMPTILLLSTFGLLLSIGVGGYLLWVGVPNIHFGLATALLTAVMLSATDPLAVVNQVKELAAPQQLGVLLEGESLFNDATAIVLFALLVQVITVSNGTGVELSLTPQLIVFAEVFFGGMVVGLLIGVLVEWMRFSLRGAAPAGLLSLFAAYSSFYVAESWFHVSGVMAVLVAAILISVRHERDPDRQLHPQLHAFWESLAYLFSTAVFVIMGLVITVEMFTQRWHVILIAIPVLLVARAVSVYVGMWLSGLLPGQRVHRHYKHLMVWGGLRGAIAVALVLTLSAEGVDHWFTIQSMVFGVVLFSMLVQAPTTPALMRKLKII